jgi:hypothetical protein
MASGRSSLGKDSTPVISLTFTISLAPYGITVSSVLPHG